MAGPEQIKKAYAKAMATLSAGQLRDAAKAFERILKQRPDLAEAHFQLGRIATRQRDFAKGAGHFEAALRAKPGQTEIWLAYLELASLHPKPDNLQTLLGRLGDGLDARPELGFYRALVAQARGQEGEARKDLEDAMARGLSSGRAEIVLGQLLTKAREVDPALAAFDRAANHSASAGEALSLKAELLRNLGRIEEALDAARAAIAAEPQTGSLYYTYASITRITPKDPMIVKMQDRFAKAGKGDPGRVYLGHALAKAMEETGQRAEVFRYLGAANRQLAKAFPYSAAIDEAAVRETQALFESLGDAPVSTPDAAPTPIFVTGLPRSGTTLVEQILASHSQCEGAGEIALLGKELRAVFSVDVAARSEALTLAGNTYRAKLAERFPGADFVTDKSIASYSSIGLIRHALPDAKIIVVRRDPGDNALSIYKNLFEPGQHRYATDLRTIARFMRLFETQLYYWRKALPDAFYELRYEDLIAEPEAQSRALVAAAGLDWEDACLSFHENKRQVDTLSATQVRQPIYKSSVAAWRKYEDDMASFWDAYGDAPD
ncbi:MAG: sulfotransferase [Litoreibacter sp.]|nr:sulfotransferase [Litoreibacter sp.]